VSTPTTPSTPREPKPVTGNLHLVESDQLAIYLTDRDYGPVADVDAETRARWERIAAEYDAWQDELREVYNRAYQLDRLLKARDRAMAVAEEAARAAAAAQSAVDDFYLSGGEATDG
jgi:hypothetical protein